VNSGFTGLGVLAPGHNKAITLSASAASFWDFVNGQRWTDLGGQILSVYEMQEGKTGECINLAKGTFYLDSCRKGDKNELFVLDPTGSTTGGSPNYWYLNVASSEHLKQYMYLTARRMANGAILVSRPKGYGGLAAWNRVCSINC
jgi:hypothetical protein